MGYRRYEIVLYRLGILQLVRHVVEHPGKLAYLIVVAYCDTLGEIALSELLRGHAYLHERHAYRLYKVHSAEHYHQDNSRAYQQRREHYSGKLVVDELHRGHVPQRAVAAARLGYHYRHGDDVLAGLVAVENSHAVLGLQRGFVVGHVVALVRGESAAAERDLAVLVNGHHFHLVLLIEALDKLPDLGGVVYRHVLVQPRQYCSGGVRFGNEIGLRRAVVVLPREVINTHIRDDQQNPDHAQRVEHPPSGDGAAQTEVRLPARHPFHL